MNRMRSRSSSACRSTSASARPCVFSRVPPVVIPNGVDVVPGLAPTAGLRILSLARLSPEKGVASLAEAYRLYRPTTGHSVGAAVPRAG